MKNNYPARHAAMRGRPFRLTKKLAASINYLASSVVAGQVTFAELKKTKKIDPLVLRNAKVLYCNLKGIKLPLTLQSPKQTNFYYKPGN